MNIELSGINVLISIGALSVFLFILILCLRAIFKTNRINALKQMGMHFRFGLMIALTFVLLSFSWTTYDKTVYDIPEIEVEDLIPIDIPPTDHPKPPPPPPPPTEIEVVPEDIIPDEEELEFVDDSVEEDDVIAYEPVEEPAVETIPLPPSPPPVEIEVDEVFVIVEQMPRFPGCESIAGTNKEKSDCANKKLLEYIGKNLKYPQIAIENGIKGLVTIQFVVNKKGQIIDAEVVRDIGGGCGAAVLKLVEGMEKKVGAWTPGMQRGNKVKVKYTLPVKFKALK